MLVPLQALCAYGCTTDDYTRYAFKHLLVERDCEGRPWLVACTGRTLLAATWDEPVHSDVLLAGYRLLSDPVPGFTTQIPGRIAEWVVKGWHKNRLGSFGQAGGRWAHIWEGHGTPGKAILRVPVSERIDDGLVAIDLAGDGQFPSYREMLVPLDAGKPQGLLAPLLGSHIVAELTDTLTAMGLDTLQVEVSTQRDEAGHLGRLTLRAMEREPTPARLRAVGAIMPLSSPPFTCQLPASLKPTAPAEATPVPVETAP